MQIQPVSPADDFNTLRDPGARPGEGGTAGTNPEGIRPLSGGVTSGQGASRGTLRDTTEPPQTKDRMAAVEELRSRIATKARLPGHTRISIEVDPSTDETRFLLLDRDSGEVVRQIPEEEMRRRLAEGGSGALVDEVF